jgi:hypothetical protein
VRPVATSISLRFRVFSPCRKFSRDKLTKGISVVGLVCDQGFRVGIFNQVLGASQIVDLPCREHQIGRIAQGVNEGVNFRLSTRHAIDR